MRFCFFLKRNRKNYENWTESHFIIWAHTHVKCHIFNVIRGLFRSIEPRTLQWITIWNLSKDCWDPFIKIFVLFFFWRHSSNPWMNWKISKQFNLWLSEHFQYLEKSFQFQKVLSEINAEISVLSGDILLVAQYLV